MAQLAAQLRFNPPCLDYPCQFRASSSSSSSSFLLASRSSLCLPEKPVTDGRKILSISPLVPGAMAPIFAVIPGKLKMWRSSIVANLSSSSSSSSSVGSSDVAEGYSYGGGEGTGSGNNGGEGGSGRGRDDDDDDDSEPEPQGDGGKNKTDALLVLASLGKSLSDLPSDLAQAVGQGRIPGSIVKRFFELEQTPFFKWLLQFGGMKERLLADDLFMTKVAIEVGVGTITKTAAELERRRENFSKELDFVIADVMMAIIADFMLVFLPAPTVPLGSLVSKQSGLLSNLFRGCPDNAFQVALTGTSYTLLQRFGAIVRNGGKLFCVATSASIIGTSATNVLIYVRKALNKDYAGNSEDVPILATSVAYGFYASVSSNLRYQFLAGVVEQRILQPWLHNQKLALSALCFVIRTGNTFLGSLMWVDYARWVGVQKLKEDDVDTSELKDK